MAPVAVVDLTVPRVTEGGKSAKQGQAIEDKGKGKDKDKDKDRESLSPKWDLAVVVRITGPGCAVTSDHGKTESQESQRTD